MCALYFSRMRIAFDTFEQLVSDIIPPNSIATGMDGLEVDSFPDGALVQLEEVNTTHDCDLWCDL